MWVRGSESLIGAVGGEGLPPLLPGLTFPGQEGELGSSHQRKGHDTRQLSNAHLCYKAAASQNKQIELPSLGKASECKFCADVFLRAGGAS